MARVRNPKTGAVRSVPEDQVAKLTKAGWEPDDDGGPSTAEASAPATADEPAAKAPAKKRGVKKRARRP